MKSSHYLAGANIVLATRHIGRVRPTVINLVLKVRLLVLFNVTSMPRVSRTIPIYLCSLVQQKINPILVVADIGNCSMSRKFFLPDVLNFA